MFLKKAQGAISYLERLHRKSWATDSFKCPIITKDKGLVRFLSVLIRFIHFHCENRVKDNLFLTDFFKLEWSYIPDHRIWFVFLHLLYDIILITNSSS